MFVRPLRRLLGRPLAVSYFHSTANSWASRKVVHKFKLADIGEGITECEVVKWSVKPLSPIQAFEPLCEVQSDKASVEITSPFDGVVKELLVKEGEIANVGAGLCLIEVDEEAAAETDPAVVEPVEVDASPPPKTPAEITRESEPEQREPPAQPQPQRRPHPLDPNAPPSPSPSFSPSLSSSSSDADVLAPPSVRHFARVTGVDLARLVPGSGKGGRIEKKDVEAYLLRTQGASKAEEKTSTGGVKREEDVVVELGRTRYGMWKAMTKSLEIPHFGYTTTLDLTTLHSLLPLLNAHIPAHYLPPPTSPSRPLAVDPSALYPAPSPPRVPEGEQYARITYLPVLLKTLARAMMEWPLFRASITPSPSAPSNTPTKPTLTIRPHADISIALSTPTGLYTPTLPSVDTQSIYAISSRLARLAHLGRQVPSQLTIDDMPRRGGTITLSNVGALGAGDSAAPVLVPGGGVAIVAVGRAKWVWDVDGAWDGKEGQRRLKVGVSWSADHRVVEGAEMAAFVECWRGWVERPERMIGEGV